MKLKSKLSPAAPAVTVESIAYTEDGKIMLTYIVGGTIREMRRYDSLTALNKIWEDYEEPEEWWYINRDGVVSSERTAEDTGFNARQVGNYFKTKEEAERAVEKLKTWKRLRDKGFEFESNGRYENLCGNGFEIPITAIMPPENYADTEVAKDLDLLFGGDDE